MIWALISIVFITPFLFMPNLYHWMELPKAVFMQVGVALLFFVCLLRGGIKFPSLTLPIGLFLGWAGLSLFWATNVYDGVTVLVHWVSCALLIVLVKNVKDPKPLLIAVAIAGFIAGLYGMLQSHGLANHIPFIGDIPCISGKYGSFFGHKNTAGRFMVATFPFAMVLIWILKGKIRWLFVPMAVTISIFLWFCDSRAALVAVICMGVVGVSLIKWKLIFPAVAIGVILIFSINGIDTTEVKTDIRTQLYAGMIKSGGSLAGVGLNNTKTMYPSLPNRPEWTISQIQHVKDLHNDYLQIWFELGYIGFFLLLGCIYSIGRLFYRNRKDSVKVAMFLSVLGLGITGMFSFPAYMPVSPMMIGVSLGVLEWIS